MKMNELSARWNVSQWLLEDKALVQFEKKEIGGILIYTSDITI